MLDEVSTKNPMISAAIEVSFDVISHEMEIHLRNPVIFNGDFRRNLVISHEGSPGHLSVQMETSPEPVSFTRRLPSTSGRARFLVTAQSQV